MFDIIDDIFDELFDEDGFNYGLFDGKNFLNKLDENDPFGEEDSDGLFL